MFFKNKLQPPGCTPLNHEDRKPIMKVVSGDTWVVSAEFVAADGGPACPKNSVVEFVLAENQFSPPIWTGTWFDGVLPDKNRAGLVHIRVPRDITKTLRRGSYMFSARVADRTRFMFNSQLVGHFLVEYLPTSEQHSIPYRDGTSDVFGGVCDNNEIVDCTKKVETISRIRDDSTGLYYRISACRTEDGEINICIGQNGVVS